LHEGGVPLDDLLGGAGAGGGEVPGEGEGAAAEVDGVQGPAGGGGQVDDVAEAALVLEGEVGGVVEIDVRLRRPVDQQCPGTRPVPVGYELGEPAVDGLDDDVGAGTIAARIARGAAK